MTDHYTTLGVARTATQDEIKKAFRKLASQHHPDKGGDTQKFQEIQAAYDTLGDAAKRQQYDNPQPQFQGFSGGPQFNMGDIFSQMFGGQSPFGQQQPRRNHVRMSLWITLLDVARGGRRPVALGTQAGTSTVEIEIPLGINDGDNVQYPGIAPGGQDLVIQFRIQPHAEFQRQGLNLVTTHKVSVWTLILGGETEVQTVEGNRLVVKVTPHTQPGTTLRLRSQGLRDQSGQKGDLMVQIQTEIPMTIAPEIITAIQNHT
jgi:DnaJ-class molecular chaperone